MFFVLVHIYMSDSEDVYIAVFWYSFSNWHSNFQWSEVFSTKTARHNDPVQVNCNPE